VIGIVRPIAPALGTGVAVFRYERVWGIDVLGHAA
jgi:hypothetical protein